MSHNFKIKSIKFTLKIPFNKENLGTESKFYRLSDAENMGLQEFCGYRPGKVDFGKFGGGNGMMFINNGDDAIRGEFPWVASLTASSLE